nr:MAG TPA: hypothetical protein [Caudoviricetes sp.]
MSVNLLVAWLVISLVDFSLSIEVRYCCAVRPVSLHAVALDMTNCPFFITIPFHRLSSLLAFNNR